MPTFNETFVAAARPALAFLVDEHGFTESELVLAGDGESAYGYCSITFSRPRPGRHRKVAGEPVELFVRLGVAPFRLDLDLEFGHTQELDGLRPIAIRELHALEDAPGKFPEREHDLYAAAKDPDKLGEVFNRLAGVLRQFGSRFFADDESLWKAVQRLRAEAEAAQAYDVISADAALAFAREDWSEAARLHEALGSRATRLQEKRLAVSRRKRDSLLDR